MNANRKFTVYCKALDHSSKFTGSGKFELHGSYDSIEDARRVAAWMRKHHGPAYLI
jgi:hypothetical protein